MDDVSISCTLTVYIVWTTYVVLVLMWPCNWVLDPCMHTHLTWQVVKVWDISSGKNVFEFCADMGKDVGVRAMDVDRAGKRYA